MEVNMMENEKKLRSANRVTIVRIVEKKYIWEWKETIKSTTQLVPSEHYFN